MAERQLLLRRISLILLFVVGFIAPARAVDDIGDLICETTTTTGTGTVNLAGAVGHFVTFVSQITSGATVPYHIRASDGKREVGFGTFTDATPDTLSRTANWSTDGSGAELTLPAGTHTVCMGPISTPFAPDIQLMTATGSGDSWDKPGGGQRMCRVELWGAGGSGGKGAAAAAGAGGGGGSYKMVLFRMADLGSTEQVTVATGGATQTNASTDGNVGGDTTFGSAGTLVTAYGGGGGDGSTGPGAGGGGGGGCCIAGSVGNGLVGGASDGVIGSATLVVSGPYGGAGGNGVAAANGVRGGTGTWGGGGGGGVAGDATSTNAPGGPSVWGGGGGGAGAEDAAPGPAAGGVSQFGGAGGAGAEGANLGTAGTQPGGGGGGSETGNSGAGGNGQARITCW